jgi:hypothetical protein
MLISCACFMRLRIFRAVFAALADPAGVTSHRPGALERAHLALGDWRTSAPGSPIPRPECARSWMSSGWPTW